MNEREQLTKMYSTGYDNGYDDGYKNAEKGINHELEELKIKLADAIQWGTFWRECYHIEHNKLLVAEKNQKTAVTDPT